MIHSSLIKFVGFDLDLTLYQENQKIKNTFQEAWCKLMESELKIDYQKAWQEFAKYRKTISGGCEIAKVMGIKNPESFAMRASINSKMYLYLKRDAKLLSLIKYLQEKYSLFLITASAEKDAFLKLEKLGIDPRHDFKFSIFGDSRGSGKANGKSYAKILKLTRHKPSEHVYIGDSDSQDVIPAKRKKIQTVMVWKKSQYADLSLPTIYDLEKWL